jgi:diaminohydroxyphosphoribosylaminopyrimidine deaminase / 5-amino-6-(5-phosphoribosylamino)uracil reductase
MPTDETQRPQTISACSALKEPVLPKTEDERWMRRALALAARGLGETNPNPVVGCVVVKGGRVVGEGWHERAGGPHAEIVALERAGRAARGATLYVNLEPCAHFGRTPPCAPRVAASGISRVVAAVRDPNPLVGGRGFTLLRRAGVSLHTGVLGEEAALLNERFLVSVRKARPFVLLKAALTLDGRIATAKGESKWITSPAQRLAARGLRRLHDAVAVGIGTVLADDPLLLPGPRVRRPFHRVVLDSRLRLPLESRLVKSAHRSPIWVLGHPGQPRRQRALEAKGVRVITDARAEGQLDPRWVARALFGRGLRSLMVEGGSELLGSFLAARLFDQIALFRAPLVLGGRGSLPAFAGPDPKSIRDACRLAPASPRHPLANPGLFELWYPVR